MAVYFDLGIDCGRSQRVADELAHQFENVKIGLRGIPDAECEVWRKENHGYHFVGVWPRGMGYGTTRYHRPELLSDEHHVAIKKERYNRLSRVSGYRRALFGGEAFDLLSEGTAEELMDHDYTDMIYSEQEFGSPPPGRVVDTFSPGYHIVLAPKAEPGASPNAGSAGAPPASVS